jgi:hypothetical protein
MRSIRSLSTGLTALSTPLKDKKKVLTSTFTTYPQDSATPITTIFIYKYLSPSEPVGYLHQRPHSFNPYLYAKLSNLEGLYRLTNEMRASA